MFGKKIIKETFYIVIISSILALTTNLFHPKGFVLVKKDPVKKDTVEKRIFYVSVKEAKIKYDNKSAFIVDTRDITAYQKSHIKGSINIPASPESVSAKRIIKYFKELQEAKELLLYCTGESCGTSKELASRLFKQGYKNNIYIMEDGFPEWEKSGYPVDK